MTLLLETPTAVEAQRRRVDDTQQLEQELSEQLGPGPMRFAAVSVVHQQRGCDLSAAAQALQLSEEQLENFTEIKVAWEEKLSSSLHKNMKKECSGQNAFTDCHVLRIAYFCSFDRRRTLDYLKKMDPRFFRLSAMELGGQLRTRTLFPCPGLRTRQGSNVFYMRPSRYHPDETPVSLIIDNLVFVMDKMVQRDPFSGVAFIANMNGWTMSNFSVDYCRKFMNVLQGRDFPAKVDLFLILNPPSWFGKIWAIMKPMLSENFRKKVHMIQEDKLPQFMELDYEAYLPDEISGGQVNTGTLVGDFVLFQQALEQATHQQSQSKTPFGDGNSRDHLRGYAARRKKIEVASGGKPSRSLWKSRNHHPRGGQHQEEDEPSESENTCTTSSVFSL